MADQEFSADQLTPDYRSLATQAAQSAGVPVDLVHRLIQTESNWNPAAVGPTTRTGERAIGLMQLMPATAQELEPGVDPTDPTANLRMGVRYLKSLLDRYPGRQDLALAAYNSGPGTVDRAGGVPNYPETQAYVAQIGDKGTQEFDASDLQPATTQEFDAADLQPVTSGFAPSNERTKQDARPLEPVQARGFTDPTSVRVTSPAKPAPPAPTRTMTGVDRSGMPVYGPPPPIGSIPVLDAPAAGVPQMFRGAKVLGQQLAHPQVLPADPHVTPTAPNQAQAQAAVSDVIEGFFKTTEPIVAGAMLTNPVVTAISLGGALTASKAATAAVTAAGGDAESARLAGNVAALAAGVKGTDVFVRAARGKVAELAADARAVRAQAEAFDQAHPESAPEGIKQAGSGATPTARTGNRLTEGQKALPPGPDIPDTVSNEPSAEPPSADQAGNIPSTVSNEPPPSVPRATEPAVPTEQLLDGLNANDPSTREGYDQLQTILAELGRRGIDAKAAGVLAERRRAPTPTPAVSGPVARPQEASAQATPEPTVEVAAEDLTPVTTSEDKTAPELPSDVGPEPAHLDEPAQTGRSVEVKPEGLPEGLPEALPDVRPRVDVWPRGETPDAAGPEAGTLEPPRRYDRPEPAPRTYDRDEAQKTYRRFKTKLTRALNAKDWPDVIRQADAFTEHYENSPEPYPDDWHRWKVAKEDAEYALQREGIEHTSRGLSTADLQARTESQLHRIIDAGGVSATHAQEELERRKFGSAPTPVRQNAVREETEQPDVEVAAENLTPMSTGTVPTSAPAAIAAPQQAVGLGAQAETDAHRATKLLPVFSELLAQGTLPKNPIELRKVAKSFAGGDPTTYTDDITDAVEAALTRHMPTFDQGEISSLRNQTHVSVAIAVAQKLEAQLPRAARSLEKLDLQQFSTPLPIAVAAQYAADVQHRSEHVLEPTAGTGHLISAFDRTQSVLAMEISPRRAALLRALGYNVKEGDYLKDLDLKEWADVVITNPPWGKYSTGKYGAPIGLAFAPGDVAERFIAKNVRDLKPGGRLVAIMPTTMLGPSGEGFRRFLSQHGTIRALIQSPPGAYETRSTSVDSLLLVWDKLVARQGVNAKLVVAPDWGAYAEAVAAIAPRAAHAQSERPAERPAEGRPAGSAAPTPTPQRPGSRSPRGTAAGPSRGTPERGTPELPAGRNPDVVAPEPGQERPRLEPERTAPRPAAAAPGEPTRGLSADAKDAFRRADASPFFAPYRLRTDLAGVRHPKLVVEARSLAGVDYPALTLQPTPRVAAIVTAGRASLEQAEQAMAAVQANTVGHYGYLAADNVGVGKSREIALTILDLMERAKAEKRPLRLLVTTKSADNVADLIDREMLDSVLQGADPGFEIVRVSNLKASKVKKGDTKFEPLPQYEHAIYVTDFYNLAPYRMALQEVGLHGIIGDEAHRFKNADAAVGGTWQSLHADIMLRVPREQQAFAYFTATPAQSVYDYQYLYGLRMWPIDGFHEWVQVVTGQASEKDAEKVTTATEQGGKDLATVANNTSDGVVGSDSGDVPLDTGRRSRNAGEDVFAARLTPSEAEQIPREWKMQGRFSARDLWREGTEFVVHTAKLPTTAKARYDQFAELARDIIDAAEKFGKMDKSGAANRFGPKSALQNAAKRIQMQPALEEAIRLAQEHVAKGFQPVLSLINVSEMNPEEGNIAAAINQINATATEKTDAGEIIDLGEIPEALIARAELLERAQALGTLPDPIQMIAEAFGPENVAFVVGASAGTRQSQVKEFQEGKRQVAVISAAGSTGISLDHRVKTKGGAEGRRVFIDVQYEWSASEAIQRYGRVDRAAQVSPPKIIALNFGSASEKKFLATVANRMASLGALSKGGAESTGANALEEFEITGQDALLAARTAWAAQESDVRDLWKGRQFRDPRNPQRPAVMTQATMREINLALLWLPTDTANAFWQAFVDERARIREAMGYATEARTRALRGEVLREVTLADDLKLFQLKNEAGHRFGLLQGVVMTKMPRLRLHLFDADGHITRSYISFTDTQGGRILSGLEIPWTRIEGVAREFGTQIGAAKIETPEQAEAAMHAGDRLTLTYPTDDKAWVLRKRNDGKIIIDGAKMAQRDLLMRHGATYSPVGNFWHVVDLAKFLERFPVAEKPTAQAKPEEDAFAVEAGPAAPSRPRKQSHNNGIPTGIKNSPAEGAVAEVVEDVRGLLPGLRKLFVPAQVSAIAETQAAVMRPELARRRYEDARAQKQLKALEKQFDKLSRSEQLAFAYAVDEGQIDTLPAWQRAFAEAARDISAEKRREVINLGGNMGYIEHYMAREWVKPGAVRAFIQRRLYAKRPMQGRGGFKMRRARNEHDEIITFREYIEQGFEPVETNPVRAFTRKWSEMNRWIAARRILVKGVEAGTTKAVLVGQQPPQGWQRYDDSLSTIWGAPVVEVKAAFDKGFMEAMHRFADEHGIKVVTRVSMGRDKWGYHVKGQSVVNRRFAGPEGVLMHEIGHLLDERYGLGEKIGLAQRGERQEELNFSEVPSKVARELRDLADLRLEKTSSAHHKTYVRNRSEVIANLVHAFVWVPEKAKDVAPNAYWALYNLVKDTPDLRGLLDIQRARSLRVGVETAKVPVGGRVIRGYYYGPPDAVRLVHNYIATGIRGNSAYDLYRKFGNSLNMVQLGFSAFHMVFTGMDSLVSQMSLGLQQASRGDFKEAAKNATWVAAGVATLGVAPTIRQLIRGHQALKHFYEHDINFRQFVHDADLIIKGGGSMEWDRFWHEDAPAKFMQRLRAAKANFLKGELKAGARSTAGVVAATVPAAIESWTKVVMQLWVPRLKLIAALDLMRMELKDLGEEPDPLEAAKVFGKVWDSIDNRMGQLIYDNLFWHNTLKDVAMASMRAAGWNIGSVRELLGAPFEQGRNLGLLPSAGGGGFGKPPTRLRHTGYEELPDDNGRRIPIYERGREPWLSRKFSYLVSMLFLVGLFGAIYQFLHTGLLPGEEADKDGIDPSLALRDIYFPRTGGLDRQGRPERASIPGYFKDLYAFLRHPVTTAEHKLNPALAIITDILENEDYFGTEVRNPDDPYVQQLLDVLTYVWKDYRPLTVTAFEKRQEEGTQTGVGLLESFAGINPAPASVTRSTLEEYMQSVRPPLHRTQAEAERAKLRSDYRRAMQAGDMTKANTIREEAGFTRRSQIAMQRSLQKSALRRSFDTLSLEHALVAYSDKASPSERAELKPALQRKYARQFQNIPPKERGEVRQRYQDSLQLSTAP